MSNITKRALATALKELLAQNPLDKITIQNLVDTAEVSRKTFYYHFEDIYDLLEWALVDQGRRLLGEKVTADTWQQGLERVFAYLEENRGVILNIHRSKNRGILDAHMSQLIRPVLQDVFDSQPGQDQIPEEDRQFILELYSYGVVSLFLYWINNGMKPEGDYMRKRINRLFSGSMEGMIRRYLEN